MFCHEMHRCSQRCALVVTGVLEWTGRVYENSRIAVGNEGFLDSRRETSFPCEYFGYYSTSNISSANVTERELMLYVIRVSLLRNIIHQTMRFCKGGQAIPWISAAGSDHCARRKN